MISRCANVTGCNKHQTSNIRDLELLITILSVCLVYVYDVLDAPCSMYCYICTECLKHSVFIPNVIAQLHKVAVRVDDKQNYCR